MLEELRIRDLGVIDEAGLSFGPGLNVLTGETGAGKTMVVQALELLLGRRADADQVRHGAASALVEGRIGPAPRSAGEWAEDGELIVSREVSAADEGSRSRARINGRMAPVSTLAEIVGACVDVHGQHESVRLADPQAQRELLDRSGGDDLRRALDTYRAAWRTWTDERAERERLLGDARERARELDRLRFERDEIASAAPQPGEAARLDAELSRLEHAEGLLAAAGAAGDALGQEGAARDALGAAQAALRPATGLDPGLDALLARLESAAAEVQDLVMELRGYAEGLDIDPVRLEALRERRALLAELTWKYGPQEQPRGTVDTDALLHAADLLAQRLADLEDEGARAAASDARLTELEATVRACGAALRAERERAAAQLCVTVEAHLAELAMPGARLDVVLEPGEPGPHGMERVTFSLAANPGEPSLPLARAASGGERSRVALAVRLALADADDTPVLVFDEVDAGIGGAVAQAVGRKLAELARGRQVLCVTHLAQLAAFADVHFAVDKELRDGRTVATVRALDEDERVVELSRMLSGSPDSQLAAGHAAELREAARSAV
jgi:DNA repair protein RecN (Recombination protein N)